MLIVPLCLCLPLSGLQQSKLADWGSSGPESNANGHGPSSTLPRMSSHSHSAGDQGRRRALKRNANVAYVAESLRKTVQRRVFLRARNDCFSPYVICDQMRASRRATGRCGPFPCLSQRKPLPPRCVKTRAAMTWWGTLRWDDGDERKQSIRSSCQLFSSLPLFMNTFRSTDRCIDLSIHMDLWQMQLACQKAEGLSVADGPHLSATITELVHTLQFIILYSGGFHYVKDFKRDDD